MIDLKKLFTMFVVLSFVVGFAFVTNGYSAEKSGKININSAGADQLVKLPRIGPKMADRIIEFRKKNGKFKKTQDLMKVKGIGEKTFKKFEHMVTV